MPKISAAQAINYARQAGFSSSQKTNGIPHDVLIVAIAIGESGLDTEARNSKPPDNSFGLTQVNMIGALGPARRRQFGISKNADLLNPLTNMQAAKKIQSSQGWRAWSVFTNGSYTRHLARAKGGAKNAADEPMGGGSAPGGGLEALNPFTAISEFFQEHGVRIAQFIGGGALMVIAFVMFFAQTKAAKQLMNVAPVGKTAKALKGMA